MSKGYGDSPEEAYFPLSPPAGGSRHGYNPAHSSVDILPAYDAPPSLSNKGKSRVRGSFDDSTDDGMAWEGNTSISDRLARRSSDHSAGNRRPSGGGPFRDAPGGGREEGYQSEEEQLEDELGGVEGLGDSAAEKRRLSMLWWRAAMINVLFIAAWYCFSTLISIYNKFMFSKEPGHYNFPYPLFVTSIHMFVQWSLSALTIYALPNLRPSGRPAPRDYASKVVPCGMATALDIGLSNLSLRTITLSFYTMCKSSSLVFVLLFAFAFRLESPSWRLVGIILIITSGVVLMVSTETKFDLGGMVEVLSASALGGLRWSLTQILLDKESMGMGNPFATLFWLAPVMGATLATVSMAVEGWGNVFGNDQFFGTFGRTMKTLGAVLFPGLLAFLMNVTEFGLIQRTSVVTLSVAGIFKEVAVIFLSMFIFHDILTPINVSGLCVTLFGIALYNVLKYRQFQKEGGGGGHGHGGHGKKAAQAGGEEGVYAPVGGRDREEGGEGFGEEEGYLASPRARGAERVLGSRNESAISLDDLGPSAPHHQLGEDSPGSSPRSSGERTIRHREGSQGGYASGGLGASGAGLSKDVSPPVSAATGDEWDLLGGEDEEDQAAARGNKLD